MPACSDAEQGRPFTATHELAHWLIQGTLFRTGDTAAIKSISKSSDADKYIEQQQDMLGSALLLPMLVPRRYRLSGDDRVCSWQRSLVYQNRQWKPTAQSPSDIADKTAFYPQCSVFTEHKKPSLDYIRKMKMSFSRT